MVFGRRISGFLLVGAGLALAAAVYRLWTLLLTNLYVPGSLAWTHPLVLPLALLLSGITILPYAIVAYRLRSTPTVLRVLLAVLTALGVWIVYPVVCDTHESFLDRPNTRCGCAGLTVRWYPRGVFDYSEMVYCIGVEIPVREPPSARFLENVRRSAQQTGIHGVMIVPVLSSDTTGGGHDARP